MVVQAFCLRIPARLIDFLRHLNARSLPNNRLAIPNLSARQRMHATMGSGPSASETTPAHIYRQFWAPARCVLCMGGGRVPVEDRRVQDGVSKTVLPSDRLGTHLQDELDLVSVLPHDSRLQAASTFSHLHDGKHHTAADRGGVALLCWVRVHRMQASRYAMFGKEIHRQDIPLENEAPSRSENTQHGATGCLFWVSVMLGQHESPPL